MKCQVWANYAIVSNEERKKMACAPRDMLIEQVQQTPDVDFLIRNVPESRWWPNNVSELKEVPGNTGATLDEWCLGPAPAAQWLAHGTAQSGVCVPSDQYVPDNEVPCGEVWWASDQSQAGPALKNIVPQQPSQQNWCPNGPAGGQTFGCAAAITTAAAANQWTVDTDSGRSVHCEDNSRSTVSMNLKFAYSVKVLFFAVKNVTAKNIHSNYTVGFPVIQQAVTDQVTLDGPVFGKKVWDATIAGSWCEDNGTLVPPEMGRWAPIHLIICHTKAVELQNMLVRSKH